MLNITCHVLVCVWKRYEWAKSALCEATVNEKEKKKVCDMFHESVEITPTHLPRLSPFSFTAEFDPRFSFQTGPFLKGWPLTWAAPAAVCALNKHTSCQRGKKKKPAAGQYQRWRVVSKMCLSPLCWSSRCSMRTWETPALLCPTSGSGCSSPRFPPRCSRWWATCGPPHSSDLTETEPLRF